ncbi:MAG: hypothetical protein LPK26_23450 [Bacillaceae bacterium]|nr:hypothetical protein [Bacillaceae bacterium]
MNKYYQWPTNVQYTNQRQQPSHYHQPLLPHQSHQNHQSQQLKNNTLSAVEPIVQYGLKEAQYTSIQHAMREVAAITYLMGRGYDLQTARQMVESWEVNEVFYC